MASNEIPGAASHTNDIALRHHHCHICGFLFQTGKKFFEKNLKRHLERSVCKKLATAQARKVCATCGQKLFGSNVQESLKDHKKKACEQRLAGIVEGRKINCEICCKVGKIGGSTNEQASTSSVKCSRCKRKFAAGEKSLRRHVESGACQRILTAKRRSIARKTSKPVLYKAICKICRHVFVGKGGNPEKSLERHLKRKVCQRKKKTGKAAASALKKNKIRRKLTTSRRQQTKKPEPAVEQATPGGEDVAVVNEEPAPPRHWSETFPLDVPLEIIILEDGQQSINNN